MACFERTYELSGISITCPNVSASFVQNRIQAEARARRTAKDKRGASEVHIDEIYSYFPFRLFGLARRDLNDLAESEFAAELELCRANPDMLRQYLDMKRARPPRRIHLRHLLGFRSAGAVVAGLPPRTDVGLPLRVLRPRQRQERDAVSQNIWL